MDVELLLAVLFVGLLIVVTNFVLVRLIRLDNTAEVFFHQARDSYWEFLSGEHGRDDHRHV